MPGRLAARWRSIAVVAVLACAGVDAYEARKGNNLRNKSASALCAAADRSVAAQLRQEHQLRADRAKGVRPDHSAQPSVSVNAQDGGGATAAPVQSSPSATSSASPRTDDDEWAGHTQIVIGSPQTTRVILPRPQSARPSASSTPLPVAPPKPEPAHISRTIGRLGRPVSGVARLGWRAIRLVGVIIFRLLRIATLPLMVPVWLAAYPLEFALALIVDFQPALSFLSVGASLDLCALG